MGDEDFLPRRVCSLGFDGPMAAAQFHRQQGQNRHCTCVRCGQWVSKVANNNDMHCEIMKLPSCRLATAGPGPVDRDPLADIYQSAPTIRVAAGPYCRSRFCYLCRQLLVGKGAAAQHFGRNGKCKQHSAD